MDIRIGRRTVASPGVRVSARRRGRPARARDERGQALLEFAYLLPILVTLILGVITFGIALNNYLEMTNGVAAGAQALSISRGQTTDPCKTVTGAAYPAAYNLTQSKILFTIAINVPPGGTGTSFGNLVTNAATPSCAGASADMIQGDTATVTATYPCNLNVFGVNFAPSTCKMTAQTAESIQ